RELSKLPSGSRRREGALLHLLFDVEMYSQRPSAALKVLARRRSLGFRRDSALVLDANLLSARLLMDNQQWFAARAKLTDLLRGTERKTWYSIFDALVAYVRADERCREEMESKLVKNCEAVVKEFGIPAQALRGTSNVEESIRRIETLIGASSKQYG